MKRFRSDWRKKYLKHLRARYRKGIQSYREYLYYLANPYGYVD